MKLSTQHRLLHDPLRIPIEQMVSESSGRQWRVSEFRDLNDFASHQCAILSDDSYAVFVKLSEAANGLEQFEAEMAGLRLLAAQAGVLTPTPIGTVAVEGGCVMLLEAVQAVERTDHDWREIGRSLALIHRTKSDRYGLERQGYFGPLYQDNRPLEHSLEQWHTFYSERRLWPRLISAIDSGNLPSEAIRQVEKLISRLPDLCGPEGVPTLLHGDAQQNNFISSAKGAVVIDPAVYYGNPEMDLAYIDYFQPVPDDVFVGYREEMPIDPGFNERRDLWRIYGYLAIVTIEGGPYLDKLIDAVKKYL